MITVASLLERIESRFAVGPPTATSRAFTGEPYVVIGSQHPGDGLSEIPGTVDEGKRHEKGYDEETACMQALACFELYAEDKGSNLYWRHKPELDWSDDGRRCFVYMRCLVSDKPVVCNP